MAKLNEEALKGLIKQIIAEEIEKGNIDEGFLSSVGNGLRRGFAGLGGQMKTAYDNTKQSVKTAANNVAQGYRDQRAADRARRTNNEANTKIKRVVDTLQDLLDNKVIHGAKTTAAAQELIKGLGMLMRANNSNTAAYRNMANR